MRVLLVTHGFPPAAAGGTELYAASHARALAGLGDRVLVLSREHDPHRPEFSVRREERGDLAIAWVNNTFAAARSFRDTYADERIDAVAAKLIDEFEPEVAHVHHLTCLSTNIVTELRARGVPVFCTLHDYWLLCHRGQLLDLDLQTCVGPGEACHRCLGPAASFPAAIFTARRVINPIRRALPAAIARPVDRLIRRLPNLPDPKNPKDLKFGDPSNPQNLRNLHIRPVLNSVTHFFAPSNYLRDRFVAAGVDPARITVSPSGWELPGAAPQRERAAPPRLPMRFGFVGSLMVSKAPHVLIEACAGLAAGSWEAHLFGDHADYHGDASYRGRLAPLLKRSAVFHHGTIARERVRAALAGIDVLVVPSIWPENSPLVVLEAFLAGIPVVASRIGGIPETVFDDVNGLLVAPGDVGDLRTVLARLISEPELLPRLRRAIPSVRTVADDVAGMRKRYTAAVPAPATRRRLAAVVLNYRTPDETFLAVRSLRISRRPIDHVIVVDNGSGSDLGQTGVKPGSDPGQTRVSPGFDPGLTPAVTHLPQHANLGFSGGMNIGIRHALEAGADAVLLVNSDVVVPVDAVEALERALEARPDAGIAGPIVVQRATPDRIVSQGISYDRISGRMKNVGAARAVASATPAMATVDAVSGCLMLVRRQVFDAIGLLDERYFYSFEDLEFCLRARQAGFATVVAPRAIALHEGGRSIGAGSVRRLYYAARNHLLLARNTGQTGPLAAARSAYIVLLNVAHAMRAPGRATSARLLAVASGTRDYLRGRFGE